MPRINLANNIPLEKPVSIRLDINNYCNMKCEFCDVNVKQISRRDMPFATCKHVIDDICESFGSVDTILFTSQGEPLLYKDLSKIIEYAHAKKALKTSKVITNGWALSTDLSCRLIDAGLSYIMFSINGLSDEDYKKHCDVTISFEKLVDNIRYFYEHRRNTIVHVKTIDYIISSLEDNEKFYNIFKPISDIISIEQLLTEDNPMLDFKSFANEQVLQNDKKRAQAPRNICSYPFYNMTINLDGNVTLCCYKDRNVIANIYNETLKNIWNNTFFNLQRKMLDGAKNFSRDCANCTSFYFSMREEDVLDDVAEACKKRYEAILN